MLPSTRVDFSFGLDGVLSTIRKSHTLTKSYSQICFGRKSRTLETSPNCNGRSKTVVYTVRDRETDIMVRTSRIARIADQVSSIEYLHIRQGDFVKIGVTHSEHPTSIHVIV